MSSLAAVGSNTMQAAETPQEVNAEGRWIPPTRRIPLMEGETRMDRVNKLLHAHVLTRSQKGQLHDEYTIGTKHVNWYLFIKGKAWNQKHCKKLAEYTDLCIGMWPVVARFLENCRRPAIVVPEDVQESLSVAIQARKRHLEVDWRLDGRESHEFAITVLESVDKALKPRFWKLDSNNPAALNGQMGTPADPAPAHVTSDKHVHEEESSHQRTKVATDHSSPVSQSGYFKSNSTGPTPREDETDAEETKIPTTRPAGGEKTSTGPIVDNVQLTNRRPTTGSDIAVPKPVGDRAVLAEVAGGKGTSSRPHDNTPTITKSEMDNAAIRQPMGDKTTAPGTAGTAFTITTPLNSETTGKKPDSLEQSTAEPASPEPDGHVPEASSLQREESVGGLVEESREPKRSKKFMKRMRQAEKRALAKSLASEPHEPKVEAAGSAPAAPAPRGLSPQTSRESSHSSSRSAHRPGGSYRSSHIPSQPRAGIRPESILARPPRTATFHGGGVAILPGGTSGQRGQLHLVETREMNVSAAAWEANADDRAGFLQRILQAAEEGDLDRYA